MGVQLHISLVMLTETKMETEKNLITELPKEVIDYRNSFKMAVHFYKYAAL
jgi:hypothetical protein